ncbi:Predicted small integral membrane protein [Ruegeria halocynthiae]|uniref:Predicted small integral membrane protein n=1 Tax=Ruegeria halocynthiae TaxID=985054 RepID=A0A1H2XSQ5_9RHOB|nr:DUF2160 domain-containing protein [Ruegeria halocynthiae]SDW95851.1 Predicted small integral membrane protein [Ruegeria halocynthiae]
MRKLLLALPFLPTTAFAQQAGWGSVGQQEEKGFSWTAPLWPDFWMAWTPATLAVFVGIFSAIALIGILEGLKYRDGIERRGVLGLTTTLGDRLFITLLGSAYIFLAWLGLMGQPVWTPLFLSIGWGIFVFRKV